MTYNGGPYVSIGTIATYDPDEDSYKETIGPLNLPYARVTDNLQTIIERTITSTFEPWEWWIDYSGQVQVAESRGSVKSITLQAGNQIGGSLRESSSKQSCQRIRVVGQGESAEQDENTSDWKLDIVEMGNINSFYEKIFSDKTITSKDVADTWAQVLLTQLASLRQEVTVRLENNPYTTDDFDVGDTVPVNDPDVGLTANYRIKTMDTTVDNTNGEVTIITCSLCRTDITDRLADIFKTVQSILTSSTFLDQLFGEGSRQRKIKADELEDVWEITSSNKWATELPEESDSTNPDDYMKECDWAGRGAISYSCDKDEFEIHADATNAAGEIFLWEPLLKFSRDPRFTCDFEIDTDLGTEWDNNDFMMIRIRTVIPDSCTWPTTFLGFGFQIRKESGSYKLRAILNDGVNNINIIIATLSLDIKYTIEARMEWKEKVVKFYFGRTDIPESDLQWGFRLRGILPINRYATDTDDLAPFHALLDAQGGGSSQPALVIYRWRTQAVRAVEE